MSRKTHSPFRGDKKETLSFPGIVVLVSYGIIVCIRPVANYLTVRLKNCILYWEKSDEVMDCYK